MPYNALTEEGYVPLASDNVTNQSTVAGANVTQALNNLASGGVNRCPVAAPLLGSVVGGDLAPAGLATEILAATNTPNSNSNSALFVPATYLAGIGGGATLAARLIELGPGGGGTAVITAQVASVIGAFDVLTLTIEGVSAAAPGSLFFAVYVGVDDGAGVPTEPTEQFAGYFILETDPP